jgi:hypothetical protein
MYSGWIRDLPYIWYGYVNQGLIESWLRSSKLVRAYLMEPTNRGELNISNLVLVEKLVTILISRRASEDFLQT